MSREQLKKLMVCSHQWVREMVEKYNDVNYKTQLSLCMRELLRQKANKEHNLF